jgi:hypothetical protein
MKSLSCMKYKEMFPLSPAFIQMNVTTFSWNDYTHLNKRGAIIIHKSKTNRQHNGQKIPKGQSESINRRRTDNTMARLPLWYLLAIVLSVRLRFMDSDCPFGIFNLFLLLTMLNVGHIYGLKLDFLSVLSRAPQ